jgi:hypothetical protein
MPTVQLPPAEPTATPRVEVVVRTDVEAGELFVDGESYGKASGGRWVLDLEPGPHKLEAFSGGSSVTSSLVTVREGVPATVVLSLPEGATVGPGADASASSAQLADKPKAAATRADQATSDAGSSEREQRRARRRARREAAEAAERERQQNSVTP